MTYELLMYMHLATVIPCFFLGGILLAIKKGTTFHKSAGKVYMVLMFFTAIVTLFMEARVGPQFLNHFGFIHLFSLLTLYTVPSSYIAIRNGKVRKHQIGMIMLYFGAIIIAGSFTFVPGRFMYELFFG